MPVGLGRFEIGVGAVGRATFNEMVGHAMKRLFRRVLPTFVVGGLFAALNVAGCLYFVTSRPAMEPAAVRRPAEAGGDAYGVFACRAVHFWAKGDRAEPMWLKILIVGNVLSVVLVVFLRMLMGSLPLLGGLSLCAQSWVAAAVFAAASTFQWYVVGAILEDRFRRLFRASA